MAQKKVALGVLKKGAKYFEPQPCRGIAVLAGGPSVSLYNIL